MQTSDRTILRDLAKQVADLAAMPVQQERKAAWRAHNSLKSMRPMILFFPEGAWQELLPAESLRCEDAEARRIEFQLRSRIYTEAHFADDTVIVDTWDIGPTLTFGSWGLEKKHIASSEARGAWKFDPVITSAADVDKLHPPDVSYDEAATRQHVARFEDLFGDILKVRFCGINHISYHAMNWYTGLRGLQEAMMDMVCDKAMIHAAMAIYERGSSQLLQRYRDLNLLRANNDNTYQSSGGNGWTDELPQAGADPDRVRPCDMWASAESQEMAQVSPGMHAEFCLTYERRLLEPFGLTGYGCCEDLTHKLDDVTSIANMRRISIAPWANVAACAEQLGDRYIFSWKPNPAMLVGDFDEAVLTEYIRRTLDATRGCVLEIVLKDTHTCEHRPERFDRWSHICRELIEAR